MGPRDNLPGCKINPTALVSRDAESLDGDDRPTDASRQANGCNTIALRTTPRAARFGTDELGAKQPDLGIVGNQVPNPPQRLECEGGFIADCVDQKHPTSTFLHIIDRVCNLILAESEPSRMTSNARMDLFWKGRIAHSATLEPIWTGRKRP